MSKLTQNQRIGYARVSTDDQDMALQKDALFLSGIDRIYEDTCSGSQSERVGLNRMRDTLRTGDTVVVWRLDRLGRSLRDLTEWVDWFRDNGIGFTSLQESVDTNSASGMLVYHIFSAMAEFERNLLRERTNAGLKAARARGRTGGRPPALTTKQKSRAQRLYDSKEYSITEICDMVGCSKPTLYKVIDRTKD